MRNSIANHRGSLLLEALLAVVILSVSLTVIIQSMTAGLRASVYSSGYTMAIFLLENKLFEYAANGAIVSDLFEEGHFSAPNQKYQYSLKARSLMEQENEDLRRVNIEVFWRSGKKKNNLRVETYFPVVKDDED